MFTYLNTRMASAATRYLLALGLAIPLAACVAPIPIKDQAPKVSYSVSRKVAVAVIDSRPDLTVDKKPPTFIGHAHTLFGIPADMQVYPWVALKEEKDFTLAQSLNSELWMRCRPTAPPLSVSRAERMPMRRLLSVQYWD